MSSYGDVLALIRDATSDEIAVIERVAERLSTDAGLQLLFAKGVDTFGDAEHFGCWLRAPSRVLDQSPLLCLADGDIESVEAELIRIDHGVFT